MYFNQIYPYSLASNPHFFNFKCFFLKPFSPFGTASVCMGERLSIGAWVTLKGLIPEESQFSICFPMVLHKQICETEKKVCKHSKYIGNIRE